MIFGDVESILHFWINSIRFLADENVDAAESRLNLLRDFHANELGFALYIIAMVRSRYESGLICEARDLGLLDHCVKRTVLHQKHRDFLFSFAPNKDRP